MALLIFILSIFNGINRKVIHIKNKGFTLLEIIVVIAILSIVVIAFLSLFTNGYSNVSYSNNRLKATMEAKSIMEGIRAIDYEDLNESDVDKYFTDNYEGKYEKINDINNISNLNNKDILYYIGDVDVSLKDKSDDVEVFNENSKKITIIVFYNNGKSYVTLSSYIFK